MSSRSRAKRLLLIAAIFPLWACAETPQDGAGPPPVLTAGLRLSGAASPSMADGGLALPGERPSADLAWQTATLGAGGTLDAALAGLGLDPPLRQRAVAALAGEIDLRRLSPRTGLAAGRDPSGSVRAIVVRPDPLRSVRVRLPDAAQPVVEPVELALVARTETVGGRIESSVHQALGAHPHGTELTLAFADIFQWDVDLLVDPRPGDRVRIVYEILELGQVPEGLPPFGGQGARPGEFVRLGRILAASYEGRVARSAAYWLPGSDAEGAYYDETGRPLRKTFLRSPLNYRRISSGFSNARRHPITRRVVPHHGVDFAAAYGTPVVASADGTVVSAGWDGPLGRAVRLRHGSEYVTVYGHLEAFAHGVKRGAQVRQNDVIGFVGDSGRATGPHLHYTLIHRGRPIDPMRFRSPAPEPLAAGRRADLDRARRAWTPVLASIETDAAPAVATTGAPGEGPGA